MQRASTVNSFQLDNIFTKDAKHTKKSKKMYWEGRRVVHSLNYFIRLKYEEGKREGKNNKMTALTHFE